MVTKQHILPSYDRTAEKILPDVQKKLLKRKSSDCLIECGWVAVCDSAEERINKKCCNGKVKKEHQCIKNRTCLVELESGETLIREVIPGTQNGKYRLVDSTGNISENLNVVSCRRIKRLKQL